MSENITHVSIYDDNRRLVEAVGERLPAVFAESLAAHNELARLGAVTRHADRHAVALLREYRARWRAQNGRLDTHTAGKLAFVIGWLSHRAADRQMKPVFRATCPDSPVKPTECSIYDDAFIYRRRYMGRADSPYDVGVFLRMGSGPDGEGVAGLRDLVRTLVQGTLIGIHTLIPDDEHCDAWLDQLLDRHQRWRIDMDRYVAAIVDPDPDKERRYIIETGFYDASDGLIACCEALQAAEQVTPAGIAAAEAEEPQSDYGQALARAWGFVLAAGAYFQGGIDETELAAALEHGVMGCDGLPV